MINRSNAINRQLQEIQTQLKQMPEGKLICSHTGPYAKWERSDGHTKTYINKKNRPLAEQLAAKKYLNALRDDLIYEKEAIDQYLKSCSDYVPKADRLLTTSTEYQKLLSPYFAPLSKELEQWMTSSYEKNLHYSENLIHQIGKNEYVRSKSEAMIAKELLRNHIPFRYEEALELNGKIIYPDFTIRHPRTGELFYWEHFGLLDEISYTRNMCSKMELYITNNIIPTINLITTYETKERPLSFEIIEEMVQFYFI